MDTSYPVVIGTGGIGSGMLLSLIGNHTLGREESRLAKLIPQEDRCKLHIITHYTNEFLKNKTKIYLIGAVGSDEQGKLLYEELQECGFITDFVKKDPEHPSTFSVCFKYENNDGGNITLTDSASEYVQPEDIDKAQGIFTANKGHGIALAAPEVPLKTRKRLLELAAENDFYRFASFASGEMKEAIAGGYLELIDCLAINIDEAFAAADQNYQGQDIDKDTLLNIISALRSRNDKIKVTITEGKKGSWCWDGKELFFNKGISVHAVNTAGAGDSYLGSLMTAKALNLSLKDACMLATLVSAQSVMAKDTINREVSPSSTLEFIKKLNIQAPESILLALQMLSK